jgi:hypothetical protein
MAEIVQDWRNIEKFSKNNFRKGKLYGKTMKKVFAIFILFFWKGFAAPIGNTADPEVIQQGFFTPRGSSMSLRLGYEADFVTDARMNQYVQSSGRVDDYSQRNHSGTITWNFVDRLDIFGVLGMSKTESDWRFIDAKTNQVHRIKLKTKGAFLWAVGSRAILYEWSNLFLGMGGRYSATDDLVSRVSNDGVAVSPVGARVRWSQWQVNLDISYKIQIFTPYIGTKYSSELSELSGFSTEIAADGSGSNTFKNRSPVGLYLGCSLSNGKFFALNLEGRLIDEEAVTVVADFRF